MLSLIIMKTSLQFNGKDTETHGTAMDTKMAVAFANIYMVSIEKEILRQSVKKPLTRKRFIDNVFSLWDADEARNRTFYWARKFLPPNYKVYRWSLTIRNNILGHNSL